MASIVFNALVVLPITKFIASLLSPITGYVTLPVHKIRGLFPYRNQPRLVPIALGLRLLQDDRLEHYTRHRVGAIEMYRTQSLPYYEVIVFRMDPSIRSENSFYLAAERASRHFDQVIDEAHSDTRHRNPNAGKNITPSFITTFFDRLKTSPPVPAGPPIMDSLRDAVPGDEFEWSSVPNPSTLATPSTPNPTHPDHAHQSILEAIQGSELDWEHYKIEKSTREVDWVMILTKHPSVGIPLDSKTKLSVEKVNSWELRRDTPPITFFDLMCWLSAVRVKGGPYTDRGRNGWWFTRVAALMIVLADQGLLPKDPHGRREAAEKKFLEDAPFGTVSKTLGIAESQLFFSLLMSTHKKIVEDVDEIYEHYCDMV